MEAGKMVKEYGKTNDLIDRICNDETFGLTKNEILEILNPDNLCGRSKNQVTEFIEKQVTPVLEKYKECLNIQINDIKV